MKFIARICNLGMADNTGDVFAPDCEFSFSETVPVTDAGRPSGLEGVFGHATIKHEGDHLSAEIDLIEPTSLTNIIKEIQTKGLPMKLWPAISGQVVTRDGQNITKARITAIDITASGNADSTIPPLELSKEPNT